MDEYGETKVEPESCREEKKIVKKEGKKQTNKQT